MSFKLLFNLQKPPVSCSECEEGPGLCALLMTALSLLMILLSLPVSLVFVVKVVQVNIVQPSLLTVP